MNKLSAILGSLVLFLPMVSLANIKTLDSLNADNQFATTTTGTTTMHMRIVTVGTDTHRFEWDSSPWRVDQGGTGASSFANGSILFMQNGVFSENNADLFWDSTSSTLAIGGTTTPSAKLSVKGSAGLAPLNVASSTGASLLYVSGAGDVGINTTSPSAKLHLVGNLLVSGSASFGGTTDVTGALYSHLVTATSSAINWNLGNVQSLTLTSSPTLTFEDGQAGGVYELILKQDGTGGRTVNWPQTVKWPGGATPTLTSDANSVDGVRFVYDGSSYLGSASLDYAPAAPPTFWTLVVGGGGGGGGGAGSTGGGGGAGGYLENLTTVLNPSISYAITVGGGGVGGTSDDQGGDGANSSIEAVVVALGGGGGGSEGSGPVGRNGGSGGGGATVGGGAAGGANEDGQGNNGGASTGQVRSGSGGGGGASAVGVTSITDVDGDGGAGTASLISGSAVPRAGGGGGGGNVEAPTGARPSGAGGVGGGGAGTNDGDDATDGTPNTGGGGGGASGSATSPGDGGDGGSGIVILRFKTSSISFNQTNGNCGVVSLSDTACTWDTPGVTGTFEFTVN